jgi:hypothetical protein
LLILQRAIVFIFTFRESSGGGGGPRGVQSQKNRSCFSSLRFEARSLFSQGNASMDWRDMLLAVDHGRGARRISLRGQRFFRFKRLADNCTPILEAAREISAQAFAGLPSGFAFRIR